ncbi:MAG: hypothetical protein SF182_21255 [Deltaproteobacteria bacterium]|nr:hypothetical protein [Deltaproteobacteria bacterium]
MTRGCASYAWVPVDLIERALEIGSTHGFNVVAIEGGALAVKVDLGGGRIVHLLMPADDSSR